MTLQEFIAKEMRSNTRIALAHPDHADTFMDEQLCLAASRAMKEKLEKKRAEGRGGWWHPEHCSTKELKEMLTEHIEKGDMVDVMNFAAMIYLREARGAAKD